MDERETLVERLEKQADVLRHTAFRLRLPPGDNNLEDAAAFMREAKAHIEALEAQLAALRDGGDAVAWLIRWPKGCAVYRGKQQAETMAYFVGGVNGCDVVVEPLYAAPAPSGREP